MKAKTIIYLTTALALASLGFYFYEKRRIKEINERVDSLEDVLKGLEEAKNKN
jgi:hypothetical protein